VAPDDSAIPQETSFSAPVIFANGSSAILFTGHAPGAMAGKGVGVASAYT